MEQVIFASSFSSVLSNAATNYNSLVLGVCPWAVAEFGKLKIISTSGKIKNLRVKLRAAPGAGKSYDFTLMVNGAPTALTLEIADAATSGANTVNEIDVVAGNTVSIRCVPTGTPAEVECAWTSMFEGATAKESLILGGPGTITLDKTNIEYSAVMGAIDQLNITENDHRQVCPTSGKIKNLYVELSGVPGVPGDAYRFTLRKNGISQTLTVTITADDTTGNDTVNEVAVAAEDVLTMMIEPLNTPAAAPMAAWGMTFVADTDGESIMLSGLSEDLNTGVTEYAPILCTNENALGVTERWAYQLGQSCTLKKLYILLSAAPGDGKSYTFTLRKGDAMGDGNLTVTITGAAVTTGNDLVNTDAIADDDYVDLEITPAGTPDVADAYWGLVSYRAPPVGLENKSANMGSKMVAAGLI